MKNIDWKILKVLYEKRSITKAADALFMTQSALTKRLRSIESERWGRQLVERTSRGVTFTEDGKYLVQKANIMLDFLQEIGDHFADRHTKMESLKLGVPNSFAKRHLPKLLAIPEKRSQSLYQDNFQLQRRDLKGSDRRYDRYRSRLRRFPVSR